MKKLIESKKFRDQVAEVLDEMPVGESITYDTDNRNFDSFRSNFYQAKKTLSGSWVLKNYPQDNICTVIRIK